MITIYTVITLYRYLYKRLSDDKLTYYIILYGMGETVIPCEILQTSKDLNAYGIICAHITLVIHLYTHIIILSSFWSSICFAID